jgi:hypothetical protein
MAKRRVYIRIDDQTLAILSRVAEAETRAVRDQATVLIIEALRMRLREAEQRKPAAVAR